MISPFTRLGGSIVLAVACLASSLSAQVINIGQISPNFTLTHRATRQPVRLSDFAGKIVVLEFFAHWCEPSALSAPDLQRNVHDYFAARGGNDHGVPVQLISVNIEPANGGATDAFVRTHGLAFVADDANESVFRTFLTPPPPPALGIPYFVVINGVAGSPSAAQWQVTSKALGYSSTRALSMRAAVNSIRGPVTAPVFVAQPASQTAVVGATVVLSAQVSGADLTYRWLRGGNVVSSNSSLTLGPLRESDAGEYALSVTNSAGTVTSEAALVFVGPSAAEASRPALLVSTWAGRAQAEGHVDARAADARFRNPQGVAAGAGGVVFVADTGNHVIRRIGPAGDVTTWAGQVGRSGAVDGPAAAAFLGDPMHLGIDRAGNLHVADNSTVRRIGANGVVATLAGVYRQSGYVDAAGAAARLGPVTGLAVAADGTVYVSDAEARTVRRISATGVVSTFAGSRTLVAGSVDGPAGTARFLRPGALAVDAAGTVYVADQYAVRKISPQGAVATLAGQAAQIGTVDGVGAAARFTAISGLAVDSTGTLYLTSANTIRRVSATGEVVTLAGGASGRAPGDWDGVGTGAQLSVPTAIAIDEAGSLYVAEMADAIRKAVPPTATRLTNLSVRALAGTGDDTLIVGLVSAGGGNKRLLVRAVGPGLSQFGVSGAMANPRLSLFSGSTLTGQNDDWDGSAAMNAAAALVGAFALPASSRDAALLVSAPSGAYTAQVAGAEGATGIALVEAYEADVERSPARLINLSARNRVAGGDGLLIVGFALGGQTARTLLIRGVGPALSQFDLSGALGDPRLTLFAGSTALAANDNWSTGGDTAAISAAASRVGAFALPAGSRDAALLLTLRPGTYTAQVSGVNAATGVALVEVYEVQ